MWRLSQIPCKCMYICCGKLLLSPINRLRTFGLLVLVLVSQKYQSNFYLKNQTCVTALPTLSLPPLSFSLLPTRYLIKGHTCSNHFGSVWYGIMVLQHKATCTLYQVTLSESTFEVGRAFLGFPH